ncbi:MAG: cytidine deaminase [Burkholderiales bacterium]|nr:cytidine deaminase [Burkholderiales bacterium]MCE7875808.1 cytidine deaminase [Betaproteobacteria bacterium PRO3]
MNRDAPRLTRDALVAEARRVLGKFALVKPSISAGGVAAALETASGRIYTGINLDLACGIGTCAEHAAIAEMLKARETAIRRIVALDDEGVLAPCGRCRELIVQVDRRNLECEVILPGETTSRVADLLPRAWLEPLFARD